MKHNKLRDRVRIILLIVLVLAMLISVIAPMAAAAAALLTWRLVLYPELMIKRPAYEAGVEALEMGGYEEALYQFGICGEDYRDTAFRISEANLRMLAGQAAEAESRGILTLREFLGYMRDQQSYGDQQSATLLGEQDNLVRIMTVHKSKGLQFPVVFCAGMDRDPVRADQEAVGCSSRLGLCVNYKDPEHRISRPTLATELFAWKKSREEMAEKIRLLYVAMTRAQEKLYLLTTQTENPVWSMPEGAAAVLSAKSYADWWMTVFQREKRAKLSTGCAHASTPYEIRVFVQICRPGDAV